MRLWQEQGSKLRQAVEPQRYSGRLAKSLLGSRVALAYLLDLSAHAFGPRFSRHLAAPASVSNPRPSRLHSGVAVIRPAPLE